MSATQSITASPGATKPTDGNRQTFIMEMNGSHDGIRFGVILLDGHQRGFFHDRLNNTVRIYRHDPTDRRVEDHDTELLNLARIALEAARAMERMDSGDHFDLRTAAK